jgi:hypothetical protein
MREQAHLTRLLNAMVATALGRASVQSRLANAIAFRDELAGSTRDAVDSGFLDRWISL